MTARCGSYVSTSHTYRRHWEYLSWATTLLAAREVARRLAGRAWPEEVKVVDFGIRSYDVAYALMEVEEVAILVDATSQGEGNRDGFYVIEPDLSVLEDLPPAGIAVDAHTMNPMHVLRLVKSLGGSASGSGLLLVGCEPADFGSIEEGKMGLSEPVAAAVDKAIDVIESLVNDILSPHHVER